MVEFNHSVCSCDARDFEESIDKSEDSTNVDELKDSIASYTDSFLRGFTLKNSLPFDDWQFPREEAFRRDFAILSGGLLDQLEDKNHLGDALVVARRWTRLDALNEEAHCRMMKLLHKAGRRHEMIRQFQLFTMILDKQLGTAPDKEIRSFFERLLSSPVLAVKPDTGSTCRIAVLPLKGSSSSEQRIAVSLAESIVKGLSGNPRISPLALATTQRYQGAFESLRSICRELDVSHLLVGSVQANGPNIDIAIRLFDRDDGEGETVQEYSGTLQDLLFIGRAIVIDIEDQLDFHNVSEAVASAPNVSLDAETMELYLQAKMYSSSRKAEHEILAEALYRRVIDTCPRFVPALTGLAENLMEQENVFSTPRFKSELRREVESLLFRALSAAPEFLDTLLVSGIYQTAWGWDWEKAEKDYRRALRLYPRNARLHVHYGIFLLFVGRYSESLHHLEESRLLDPGNIGPVWNLARWNLRKRHFKEARSIFERILSIERDHWPAFHLLGLTALMEEDFVRSEIMLQQSISLCSQHPETYVSLGVLYARSGKFERAAETMSFLETSFPPDSISPITLAVLMHEIGETERTTTFLQQAVNIRDSDLLFSAGFPLYEGLWNTDSWRMTIKPYLSS